MAPADSPATVFIGSQFQLGYRFLFQTDIVPSLVASGCKIVGMMPLSEQSRSDLEQPGIEFLPTAAEIVANGRDSWGKKKRGLFGIADSSLEFLRGTGMSRRMNLSTVRHYRQFREKALSQSRIRPIVPALRVASSTAQRFAPMRRLTETGIRMLNRSRVLRSYFEQHRPSLVITGSPGWWPADYLLMLEAKRQGVPVIGMVVGWDHTSSKGLSVVHPDLTICWSDIQKRELVDGGDFDPEKVEAIGPSHFDYYHRAGFALEREEYFKLNGLDTDRKLITFGCSFVGMSSNVGPVKALAKALDNGTFGDRAQVMIRLHPSHLKEQDEMRREVEAYKELERMYPHLSVQFPEFNEGAPNSNDLVSIVSLLKHSDVFVTVMSTMALEAAITGTPCVTTAIDPEEEWRWKATLPISEALEWPTHKRILESESTITAHSYQELSDGIVQQLEHPDALRANQRNFALREATVISDDVGKTVANRIMEFIRTRAG